MLVKMQIPELLPQNYRIRQLPGELQESHKHCIGHLLIFSCLDAATPLYFVYSVMDSKVHSMLP